MRGAEGMTGEEVAGVGGVLVGGADPIGKDNAMRKGGRLSRRGVLSVAYWARLRSPDGRIGGNIRTNQRTVASPFY
jgi:hypothetical protein